MKQVRTRAIVLRRTNYGEADRIIQLLTPVGRRAVMARAVRREKSKLAGGIELFAISDVVIGEGKGELGIITSARLVQFYRHIMTDYDRTQFGYEMLKQIAKASETLDEPEWYDIASEVLMGLDNLTVPLELTQTWFYLHYSAMLGYELNIQRDYRGGKLLEDTLYRYDESEKGFIEAQNGVVTANHIKILRLTASKSIQTITQVAGIEGFLPDCLDIARRHAAI